MKLNWGTGIVLAFIGFISFIMFFVIRMNTNDKYDHDLVNENLFKLVTNPMYFNSLHWEQRREMVLKLVEQISDIDFLNGMENPNNELLQLLNNGDYKFYLVDLNRMEFKSLDFETRIKNFSRLTIHKSMVEIMSDEYAKCSGYDYEEVFGLMWYETEVFQEKYHRKRRLKKKLKFWKAG